MKKLLSITLLIIAVLLGSCKEESSVSRIEKGTTKKVKALSYTFNSTQNEDGGTVKSGNSTDSTKAVSPIERKVISVETWEAGGEMFVASLIEENDPIATKAPTQEVNGSSVYTFYAYKDSKIKLQTVAPKGTFDVPVDEATNYGMIFLSSAKGMENPNTITSPTINESKKEITYKAAFNENVCYASFDKVKMPPGNPIDVTFTPVFSQLGIYVPSKVTGTTITVEKVRLVSGGQQEATVKVVYNSNATNNIDVTYNDNLANYAVDLTHKLNPADNITYLESNGKQGYYNIIPNNNPAQVYIKLTAAGITKPMEKTIEFKNTASKPISFISGKRYTIKIENGVTPKIEITPADNTNLVAQSYTLGEPITLKYGLTQQLKAEAVYPDGTREDITKDAGTTWRYVGTEDGQTQITDGASVDNTDTDKKGLVTLIKVGTSKITATYQGVSGTANIKPQVYRTFTIDDYYQWDAYEHYEPTNWQNAPWQLGSPGYNPKNTTAEQSCAGAPSYEENKTYIGNGVKWSEIDGLIFTSGSDGTSGKRLYCKGIWLKKWGSAGWDNSASAVIETYKPADHGRPVDSVIGNYFFLPACGLYYSGSFKNAGTSGFYWSSTPATFATNAYCLYFNTHNAYMDGNNSNNGRSCGMVPMVGFDDSYVPATVRDITISPAPLNIEPGQAGDLTATVTMSDGTDRTTGFTWEINSPKGVVTDIKGNVQSPSPQILTWNNSPTNTLSLTANANYYGSTTVTVTYGGVSKTVSVNVYRDIPATKYYMWDAPVEAYYSSIYPNNNYSTANNQATQSCANAPTYDQMQMYLGAGVYWVTDGPPFKTPDNKIYRAGLMVKKSANITNFGAGTAPKEIYVTTQTGFSSKSSGEQQKYFFLPACGLYNNGIFFIAGTYGYYWSSTPPAPNTVSAYYLGFNSGGAGVVGSHPSLGCVPMPRL